MASKRPEKPDIRPRSDYATLRWLGIGGAVALVLAALALLFAWQHADDDRYDADEVKARVAAEMNRIEAETNRIEREASQ